MSEPRGETPEAAPACIEGGTAAARHGFERARRLEAQSRNAAATAEYTAFLEQHPTDVPTLNALGRIFTHSGNFPLARSLLRAASVYAPGRAVTLANLALVELLDGDLAAAAGLYRSALRADPRIAAAYHGLAEIAERRGDAAAAERYRARGLQLSPIALLPFTGEGRPLRVLTLGTATQNNIAADDFFDPRQVALASAIVDELDPATPLPPHDLIFTIVGEADGCPAQLATAAEIVRRSGAPVINHPLAVLATGRAENARRLGALDDVIAPQIETVSRAVLAGADAADRLAERNLGFPLLIRALGYHTGDYFVKVERPDGLAEALAAVPGDPLLVIEFLDTADAAADIHKYRVMIVDGALYPLHLAIARQWKVHYFSAEMSSSAVHRARDAAFLRAMEATIGNRAVLALERIRDALELDYAGIDFTLAPGGEVIVFEANALMKVPVPPACPIWDYRREPVARIQAAVRTMLAARARGS